MLSRGRLAFILSSLAVLLLVVGGSLWAATSRAQDDGRDSLYKYLSVFTEVLKLIDRAYVDETDPDVLMGGALEGVTDALGPFSTYVPASRVDDFVASREVGTRHSGLLVLKERGVAYAMSVVPGSPAAEAGIERGDLIATIQGRRTRPMPVWEIQALLAGPPGTRIELHRIRMGEQADVAFTLAEFPPPGTLLEVRRGVPVLRLRAIGDATPGDVETSLETLRGEGPSFPDLSHPDKLVLDLRDLAQGDPAAAYRVAELFAGGGELGVLRDRDEVLETFTSDAEPSFSGSLVVLINRGTQGAAEVLASVLHQRLGAQLIGEPTFGHCGRPSLVPLSNGDRLEVTTAFFTGPDREPIDDGLEPDEIVRPRTFTLDEEAPDDDPVLERALEVVLGEVGVERKKAA
ncbi:MAG: PDZ domain-containing protein [Acidobacteria bacterium]|nr:MAG: PDZ domain-containing protein [Acidobacteriota bacterium]